MITRNKLEEELNELLHVESFTDYCTNGVQVVGKEPIKTVSFGVTASLEIINEAVLNKADALIVHHGLFWHKESQLIDENKARKLRLLLNNEISLMAYHLPLDAHEELGNNWGAARDLGWSSLEKFAHIGVKGLFSEVVIEEALNTLETYFQHKPTSALFGKKKIKSAAFVSGGGYQFLNSAAKEGIDLFITGNFDEPAWWIAKEEKINFVAFGHAATEKTGIKKLKEYIEKRHKITTLFIDLDNPF